MFPEAFADRMTSSSLATPVVDVLPSVTVCAKLFVPKRASLIWSVLSDGFFWNSNATSPAMCGEAMLVPCRTMRLLATPCPPVVIRSVSTSVAFLERAALITSPGAMISGLARPSRVGPSDEKVLYEPSIAPEFDRQVPAGSPTAVQHFLLTHDPTVIAPAALPGSPRVVRYDCEPKVAPPLGTHASHSPVLPLRAKSVRARRTVHPAPVAISVNATVT